MKFKSKFLELYNLIMEDSENESIPNDSLEGKIQSFIEDIKKDFDSTENDETTDLDLLKRRMKNEIYRTFRKDINNNIFNFLKDNGIEGDLANLLIHMTYAKHFDDWEKLSSIGVENLPVLNDLNGKNIYSVFSNKLPGVSQEFINKILNFNYGKKNSAAIGKYEIGLALFCKDVILPPKNGDIGTGDFSNEDAAMVPTKQEGGKNKITGTGEVKGELRKNWPKISIIFSRNYKTRK